MSAASLATSVPEMPMAMPMSARAQRRGVVDAVAGDRDHVPLALQRGHDPHLLVGADAREDGSRAAPSAVCSSASRHPRAALAGDDARRGGSRTSPISRAMASAVCGWSPVTMIDLDAGGAAAWRSPPAPRGAAGPRARPAPPATSWASQPSRPASAGSQRLGECEHPQSARRPWPSLRLRIRAAVGGSSATAPPAVSTAAHSGSTVSGAPLQ